MGGSTVDREFEKFVQDCNDEVTVRQTVPHWLWQGNREHLHPAVRIKHDPPLLREVKEPSGREGTVSYYCILHILYTGIIYTSVEYFAHTLLQHLIALYECCVSTSC
jgi:hypothetical protein